MTNNKVFQNNVSSKSIFIFHLSSIKIKWNIRKKKIISKINQGSLKHLKFLIFQNYLTRMMFDGFKL